jgi:hypothetical protein
MKKLGFLMIITFLIPQVIFAVWWNPLSWSIFNKKNNPTKIESKNKAISEHFSTSTINTLQATSNNKKINKPSVSAPNTKQEDISSEELEEVTSQIKSHVSAKADTYSKYNAIREQMVSERLNGTGMYAIPQGSTYSPDQIRMIYNSADNYYQEILSAISNNIKGSKDYVDTSKNKRCADYYITKQALENQAAQDGVSLNTEFGRKLDSTINQLSDCY